MCDEIMIVGGTFDRNEGKPSSLIEKLSKCIFATANNLPVFVVNGGNIGDLQDLLNKADFYKYIFWFANVDNSEEKHRNVKEVAPHSLLITSKRNDFVDKQHTKQKYDFEDLLQRTLELKANLCFEFCKLEDKLFRIKVFDPLGCVWYEGTEIIEAAQAAMRRLEYLASVTRKPSVNTDAVPDVVFNNTDRKFLEFVKSSANEFHRLMCLPADVKRFVGNASLRFKAPTRCMNGFPAIRKDDYVLISRRNVDKTGISEKDFVPCFLDDDGNVAYGGENKPSVDSPVQLRLFRKLPNIDYILHGHCYVKNAPMTSLAIPCGAIEEVDEVLKCIENNFVSDCYKQPYYAINLKGHGCLIMINSSIVDAMPPIEFYTRILPEKM